jgi:hypothetical protein
MQQCIREATSAHFCPKTNKFPGFHLGLQIEYSIKFQKILHFLAEKVLRERFFCGEIFSISKDNQVSMVSMFSTKFLTELGLVPRPYAKPKVGKVVLYNQIKTGRLIKEDNLLASYTFNCIHIMVCIHSMRCLPSSKFLLLLFIIISQ